jgi:DNA-binding MarR family transcriptional regulator
MGEAAIKRAPLDQETRIRDDDHDALRLWLRLLTCTSLIEGVIRARLRASFECTLPRFDLMAQLDRHPEGLKMGELSRRLMVTGGNVTGITDQLVQEGLVARDSVPSDRRACLVKLTPAGRKAFLRMAQELEQWLIRAFSHVPDGDKKRLHALLGQLKNGLVIPGKQ